MRLSIILLCCVFIFLSCNQADETLQEFETPEALMGSLPTVKPQKMAEFSEADSLLFGYLGLDTIPLEDSSFAMADPQSGFIAHVDSTGKLIKQIARRGRGPGEFLDVFYLPPRPGGGFTVYDQRGKKAIFFDSNFEYEREVVLSGTRSMPIYKVYDLEASEQLMAESAGFQRLMDDNTERKTTLAILNGQGDRILSEIKINAQPYVVLSRGINSIALHFAPRQLIRFKPETQTLISYWTGSNVIAEVDAKFDTLKTIEIDIPAQQLNESEIDSLEEESFNPDDWKLVEEQLPKEKTPVLDMRLDEHGRFWLKLGYQSDYDQWLITDREGNPQKIVQLPKGTYLTHVSEHHLGVRMGPGTFALFEPVE